MAAVEQAQAVAELGSAFRDFERASGALTRSYRELEQRVAELAAQLSAARRGEGRRRAEAERLSRRLQRLLEVLPAGVVVLDGDGRVDDCNPAAEALLGAGMRGARWREVVAERFAERPGDGPDLRLRSGRRVHLTTCSLAPEPGQLLLLADVTETRELQARMEQVRRLCELGNVAATLAHQIRTPLAAALLDVGALRGLGGQGPAGAALERIAATLRRLERLVEDLLAFARRGRIEVERFDLGEALVEHLERIRPRLAGRGCEITLRAAAAPVTGSREALLSALDNLLENAAQAGARRVEVALAAGPTLVELRVSDDGPGMAPVVRERAFEPFFTTRADGTGLGLAIARGVAESHGGRLELVRTGPQGTRLRMLLPAPRAVPGGASRPAAPARPRGEADPADCRPDEG